MEEEQESSVNCQKRLLQEKRQRSSGRESLRELFLSKKARWLRR